MPDHTMPDHTMVARCAGGQSSAQAGAAQAARAFPAGSSATTETRDTTSDLRVLVYDRSEVYRVGARAVLEGVAGVLVVSEVGDPLAMGAALQAAAPSLVLLGAAAEDAVALTAVAAQLPGAVPILVVAAAEDTEAGLAVLAAGARGYLLKDTPAARLLDAVRLVAAGGLVLAPSVADRVVERISAGLPCDAADGSAGSVTSMAELTPRQREVLRLVAGGLSNAEIARSLHVTVATVKSHLSGALRTLDVRDRTQLAVLVHQKGLGNGAERRDA